MSKLFTAHPNPMGMRLPTRRFDLRGQAANRQGSAPRPAGSRDRGDRARQHGRAVRLARPTKAR
jgi:hypothetical protein